MIVLIIVFGFFAIGVSIMMATPPQGNVTKTDRFIVTMAIISMSAAFSMGIYKEIKTYQAKEYLKKLYNVKKIRKHDDKYVVILSSGQYKKFDIGIKYVIKELK